MKKYAFLLLPLILSGCFFSSWGEVVKFNRPDIKDEFCGVEINYQYCKCAFHDEFCDAIGLDKDAANTYVRSEYDSWVTSLLEDFETTCVLGGGLFSGESCKYCKNGERLLEDTCVALDEYVEPFKADGPLSNDCELIQDQFDQEWKKYSDIDDAIPFEERSYEAKQAVTVYDDMIDKMVEGFELERDYEIEKQMQEELVEYRDALVMNIKTNLLKAFWRLSWVTYTTVKSGQGLGSSYSQVLTSGASVETIGAGLKVVQGVIPGDSQLAIDTNSVTGKAKSVGANVALEVVDSLGDPVKIATELFKSAANAPLPSANISQEEVDILRNQHIEQGLLDEVLAESRAQNETRQARMAQLEVEIADLQSQIADWEAKEKERVAGNLVDSCKQLKEEYEKNNEQE